MKKIHNHYEEDIFFNSKNILPLILGFILYVIAVIDIFPNRINIPIYFISYLLISYDIAFQSLKNILINKTFNDNFLICMASIGALCINKYIESIAIMIIYKISEVFKKKIIHKYKKSIKSLISIKTEYTNLYNENGNITKISPNDLKVGDLIIIKSGEQIPIDGIIKKGTSSLDTSALTGKTKPTSVGIGDEILSGCINKNGTLILEVTKTYKDSTANKILNLFENVSINKSKTEKLITKFAKIYTPTICILAILIATIPTLIFGNFSNWIYRALSLLIISCSCSLTIFIPISFLAGIGIAIKNGILIKKSKYLEILSNIDTIIFDKTGTITYGNFNIIDIHPAYGYTAETVLEHSAYAENFSNHPIATCINKQNKMPLDLNMIKSFEEISGYGTIVKTEEGTIIVGNSEMMKKFEIKFEYENTRDTAVYVAFNNNFMGTILLSDVIKTNAHKSIKKLYNLGIKNILLLTGDRKKIANDIAKKLGIKKAFGKLLPIDKLNIIKDIYKQNPNSKIAFVGDGINDAIILTRADVSIAMGGTNSDNAKTANIIIMTDELSKIADAIKISRYTQNIILQNIIFSISIKLIILILTLLGFSNMWLAIFTDIGITFITILNSIRISNFKL